MQNARDFRNALVVALISIGLTVGSLSISLVEFAPKAVPSPTASSSPPPLTATFTLIPTITLTVGLESPTPSVTFTFTVTATPPVSCPPPAGWNQILVQAGETLDNLSQTYHASKDDLRNGNCLLSDNLVPGSILYVPAVAPSTPTACNQGALNWNKSYVVIAGDTLYKIATSYYSSVGTLKSVNCKDSDVIHVGEVLWVPIIATRTPTPAPAPIYTSTTQPTDRPTEPLPFTMTIAPSDTLVPATATPTPTNPPATDTLTPVPSLTASPTPFPP